MGKEASKADFLKNTQKRIFIEILEKIRQSLSKGNVCKEPSKKSVKQGKPQL